MDNQFSMAFDLQEKYFEQAEAELSATFPTSYRNKMLTENGGEVTLADEDWELFPIKDSSDRKRLARTCNNVIHETQIMREWDGWPENGVAIGANGCGDCLVMLSNNQTIGPIVYVWKHETRKLIAASDDLAVALP